MLEQASPPATPAPAPAASDAAMPATDVTTLAQIERAITYWQTIDPPRNGILCPQVSCLADVLGTLWYHKAPSIASADLTPAQQEAMRMRSAAVEPAPHVDHKED